MSLHPDGLLSPAGICTENICLYEDATGKPLTVNETIYLPTKNQLLLSVPAEDLKSLECSAEFKSGITYANGTAVEGKLAGTLVPALTCEAFSAGVISFRLLDEDGKPIIRPAAGCDFSAEIMVVNSSNEIKSGTLSLFVKNNEDMPFINDEVTIEAGKTETFSYDVIGMNLYGNEIFSASFAE